MRRMRVESSREQRGRQPPRAASAARHPAARERRSTSCSPPIRCAESQWLLSGVALALARSFASRAGRSAATAGRCRFGRGSLHCMQCALQRALSWFLFAPFPAAALPPQPQSQDPAQTTRDEGEAAAAADGGGSRHSGRSDGESDRRQAARRRRREQRATKAAWQTEK